MPPGTTKARELPDKECFDLWMELGSATKVATRLAAKGVVNVAGNPFHYSSVYNACLRYILENMDETRGILQNRGYDFASDDTQWFNYCVHKAWTRWMTEPFKFVAWMDKNKLDIEFYKYIYPEHIDGVRRYWEQYQERKIK